MRAVPQQGDADRVFSKIAMQRSLQLWDRQLLESRPGLSNCEELHPSGRTVYIYLPRNIQTSRHSGTVLAEAHNPR
jgi:hypothetical protein